MSFTSLGVAAACRPLACRAAGATTTTTTTNKAPWVKVAARRPSSNNTSSPDKFAEEIFKDLRNTLAKEMVRRNRRKLKSEWPDWIGSGTAKSGHVFYKHNLAPRPPPSGGDVEPRQSLVKWYVERSKTPVPDENMLFQPGDLQSVKYKERLRERIRKRLGKGPKAPLDDTTAHPLHPPSPQHRAVELRGLPPETGMAHIRAALEAVVSKRAGLARDSFDVVNRSLRRSDDRRSVVATLEFRTAPIALEVLGLVASRPMQVLGVVPESSLQVTDSLLPSWPGRQGAMDPATLKMPFWSFGTAQADGSTPKTGGEGKREVARFTRAPGPPRQEKADQSVFGLKTYQDNDPFGLLQREERTQEVVASEEAQDVDPIKHVQQRVRRWRRHR